MLTSVLVNARNCGSKRAQAGAALTLTSSASKSTWRTPSISRHPGKKKADAADPDEKSAEPSLTSSKTPFTKTSVAVSPHMGAELMARSVP